MKPYFLPLCVISAFSVLSSQFSSAADAPTKAEATEALHKAVAFYRTQAGYQGAYLYRYSADLTKQEGENKAHKTTGWTEPPGTPAVGDAYLKAGTLTGDDACLEAAREAAEALIRGQLRSGGWEARFELDPEHRKQYAYRVDDEKAGKRNITTFDDNKSQSALTLLMRLDETLAFKDERIHEAVTYALEHMLAAQYRNGAWPQRYSGPPENDDSPPAHASYPETWSRTFPKLDYTGYYTLNDNNMEKIIGMLFEAHRIYGRNDCRDAAMKTGDFFLLAQMPDPQPGWAQQYNPQMQPAWARKFEPPAVTGGESQGVMTALLGLYRATGEKKYLEPLPRALAYYKKCLLSDGRLARFYELKTNKPLYFTKEYELTYRDDDVPTHYGFIVDSKLDRIETELDKLTENPPARFKYDPPANKPPKMSSGLQKEARQVIDALDDRGAWVEAGRMDDYGDDDPTRSVIDSKTFMKNLQTLAHFIAASE